MRELRGADPTWLAIATLVDLPFSILSEGREAIVDHNRPFVLRVRGVERSSQTLEHGRHGVIMAAGGPGRDFELLGDDGFVVAGGRIDLGR